MQVLNFEQQLDQPVETVWELISTSQGLMRFFAVHVELDLSVDGLMDVWFFPQNPAGLKGAEGMRVLAIEAPYRLQFTWNQPPFLKNIQNQRTVVELLLKAGDKQSSIILNHSGWGKGAEWEQAQAYFSGAWPMVLKRLAYVCEGHEIDWDCVPENLSFTP